MKDQPATDNCNREDKMDRAILIECIGYLGSALVLVAFLMSSGVKLRIVNTVGSLIFAAYALIIRSHPTAIMNFCLVGINIYFLWKLRHRDHSYRLLSLKPDESYVQDFLKRSAGDIARFFPNRDPGSMNPNRVYMVFHGNEPAGIMLGHENDGVLNVALDYSTPAYRDCSVGLFILENLSRPMKIRYDNAEDSHVDYLKRLGFSENNGVWEKSVS